MKKLRYLIVVGILLVTGMLMAACAAKLNPRFQSNLHSALEAKKSEFKQCYETALQGDRDVKGSLKLHLAFQPKATQPHNASVVESDINDPQMKQCVCKVVRGTTTPAAPGKYVEAKYTVDFDFE